jgi:hypothetical protein
MTGAPSGGGFAYTKISTTKAEPYAHLAPSESDSHHRADDRSQVGNPMGDSKKGVSLGKANGTTIITPHLLDMELVPQ